jgi:anti-sigma B factor antagonist
MAEPEKAHLKVTRANGVCVVEFEDRKILEEICIAEIGEMLSDVVSSEPKIKLVASFRNVEHLSSAALGMLVNLRKQVQDTGGSLKLSNIRPQIYEVFKITKLHKLFEIHDTAAQAMHAFTERQE